MTTFGERLHDALVMMDVSVEELATRRHVLPETIAHWLTLETPDMAAMHLLDLSIFLHVRVRWLGLGIGVISPLMDEPSTA